MALFLVTGGAGFIGSHIAEALVDGGHDVRILDNLESGSMTNVAAFLDQVEFIEGAVQDRSAVEKAVKGVDGIFHEAALASVPRSVETPLDSHDACLTGTVVVLDQARRNRVKRVVLAASSSAYGDQPWMAKRESDPAVPLSPYAAAKLAAEMYCQAFYRTYGLETVCLRYFNVFGPRQDPNSEYSAVIPKFITAILSNTQPVIFGDGMQSRDFAFVANVVEANLLAFDTADAVGKTFNVANGRSTTLRELLDTLNRLLNTNVQPIYQPARIGDVRESMADITMARSILGYEPKIDLEEGLRRSIEYYRRVANA